MGLNAKHIPTFDNHFTIHQVKAKQIRKPLAYAQACRLGRGINLGNALEAPNEGDWGMVIQDDYFRHIKEAGFDTTGVPITL